MVACGRSVRQAAPGPLVRLQPTSRRESNSPIVLVVRTRSVAVAGVVACVLGLTGWPASASTHSPWTIQPVNGVRTAALWAVSCASPSMCMAVGWGNVYVGISPVAARWDGESWTAEAVPKPAGGDTWGLNGVSCPSVTMCVAVGSGYSSGPDPQRVPLFEQWNGVKWQSMPVAPPNELGVIYPWDVSCPSANECVAVGYTLQDGVDMPLVARWEGVAWSLAAPSMDAVGTRSVELNAVSCPVTHECVAVGQDWNYGHQRMIALRIDEQRITKMDPVDPPSAVETSLYDVSCWAAGQCAALGAARPTWSTPPPLVERLDGSAWTVQAVPAAPKGDSDLIAVSCTTSSCVAIGTSVLRWDGGAWQWDERAPVQMNDGWFIADLSCVSTGPCTAVGQLPLPHHVRPFAERSEG